MKFQNITFTIRNEVENFLSKHHLDFDKRDFIITSFLIYQLRTNRDWSIGITINDDGDLPFETHLLDLELNPDMPFRVSFEDLENKLRYINSKKYFSPDQELGTAVDTFKKTDYNVLIKKVSKLSEPVIDYNEGMTLVLSEEWECKLIYNEDFWKKHEVEDIVKHLEILQNSIFNNPEEPIKSLRLLTDEEWQKVVYEWNDYVFPYPNDKFIHQLFEENTIKFPDLIAVSCGNKTLTYRELNEQSNQLARYLQKRGVGSEDIIGICIERSLEMIVGLMGILKAGAAYTPLDLNYPLERLEYMLDMTESPFVITVERWRNSLPGNVKSTIFLDTDKESILKESTENISITGNSENLSCVLFTSGSTGKPKGVCLPHKGVVRLVKGTNYVTLNKYTIMMGVTTLAFDPSLLEVWGSLTNGGKLVLVPSMQPSMAELKDIVKKNQINTIFLSTALMHLFIEQDISDLTSIRHLMTGGDVYSLTHAKKAKEQLPDCMVMNGYGPTENTTYSSFFEIKKDNLIYPTVPIGIPISNSQMYVLDKWLQPLPVGVPGELYAAGDGLARGYLKRPDLTAERFLPNPFHPELSPFMYKTGDQSKYLPDGNVEFMGRFDNQVKVRGVRIELGEIEAAINLYPGISESVVIAHGTNANDKQLLGYVVAMPDSSILLEDLKNYLIYKLPSYMIPAFLTELDVFPLTPNGKIDKKSLPLPSAANDNPISKDTKEETVTDALALELIEIWKQVLQLNKVGINENFFLLGGNSLLAVKLISEINLRTAINLPVITVFSRPTINELVKYIKEELSEASWSSLVPIQPNGSKKPLYCIHPVSGEVDYVYRMAPFFGPDQPIYGLQAAGLNGKDPLLTSIEEMAQHYLKLILQNEPEGPYHIAGYSLGGIIAYELAIQLKAMGKEVKTLVLFDTYPHKRGQFTYLHMPIPTVLKSFKNYILDPSIDLADKLSFISKKTPDLVIHATSKFKKTGAHAGNYEEKQELSIADKLKINGTKASLAYNIKPYDGRVIFFRATEGPAKYIKNYDFGWKKLIGEGIKIHDLPGGHLDFFLVPNNPENIAKTLESYL